MAKPGRHEEGARTRERVLGAAARLIASRGYAATSVAQIARASGANPASIYWAFGSKEGLFAAVMERSAESWFLAVAERPRGEDPWESLKGLAEAFRSGPEFLRLLLVLSLERRDGDPTVLKAARRVRAQAAQDLARMYRPALGIEDELAGRRIAMRLARLTLMLLDGVFVASQIEVDSIDMDREFELIAISTKATAERLVEEARDESCGPEKGKLA